MFLQLQCISTPLAVLAAILLRLAQPNRAAELGNLQGISQNRGTPTRDPANHRKRRFAVAGKQHRLDFSRQSTIPVAESVATLVPRRTWSADGRHHTDGDPARAPRRALFPGRHGEGQRLGRHRVQTVRGPKVGTGVSSGQGSADISPGGGSSSTIRKATARNCRACSPGPSARSDQLERERAVRDIH